MAVRVRLLILQRRARVVGAAGRAFNVNDRAEFPTQFVGHVFRIASERVARPGTGTAEVLTESGRRVFSASLIFEDFIDRLMLHIGSEQGENRGVARIDIDARQFSGRRLEVVNREPDLLQIVRSLLTLRRFAPPEPRAEADRSIC